jgi:hypothetical protein
LNCDKLIAEFEEENNKIKAKAKAAAAAATSKTHTLKQEPKQQHQAKVLSTVPKKIEGLDPSYFADQYTFEDFDKLYKNLELHEVVGLTEREGRAWLLIRWTNTTDCDLVPLDYLRHKFERINGHMKELLYFKDI